MNATVKRTHPVSFGSVNSNKPELFSVAPAVDPEDALAHATDLISAVRERLSEAVGKEGMDENEAYLCEKALEMAGALIEAINLAAGAAPTKGR